MGREIPNQRKILEEQLERSVADVQVLSGDSEVDLHDERDRELQPAASEGDEDKERVRIGRRAYEDALSGDNEDHREMDAVVPELGADSGRTYGIFRGQSPTLTGPVYTEFYALPQERDVLQQEMVWSEHRRVHEHIE